MAWLPAYTRMILELHKREPITGDFLAIGRQTVGFDFLEAKLLLREVGLESRFRDIGGPLDDRLWLGMWSDATLRSLDVSDYEGAELIYNLNYPIPATAYETADFIFEGSCLDNIWNVGQAMLNIDRMLRIGGRLFMVNAGNIVPKDTFVALGEEWYEGFLKANGYGEISVETWSYDKVNDWRWHKAYPTGIESCCVCVSARKVDLLSAQVQPIQYGYAIQHDPNWAPRKPPVLNWKGKVHNWWAGV